MNRRAERGFTLVEIMIVVAIIALLAAIAIPNILRGRTSANESAAIGNVRAVVSSIEMFRSVNNTVPVAGTWAAQMYPGGGQPAFGPPSFNGALGGVLAVQGYNYTYVDNQGTGAYTLVATPVTLNTTGTRSFFANESGAVRHCVGTGTAGGGPNWATLDAAPTNPCT